MARIRTIKPEFWSDETVGSLSPNSRLLFIASWSLADDEGLLPWTASFLRAQVFGYDDLSLDQISAFMNEITGAGLVHPYQDGKGKSFGWIVKFRKHQKIDKPQPAKHPLPSLQNHEVRKAYAVRDGWVCHVCGDAIDPATSAHKRRLSLDHLHPQGHGGLDAPSNIKTAHFGCNAGKKDRMLGEYSENGSEQSAEEGKGKEGKDIPTTSGADAPDVASLIFGQGLVWLKKHSGQSDKHCRSLLGKWRKEHGDERLVAVLGKAQREAPIDAVAWMERALPPRPPGGAFGKPVASLLPPADEWEPRLRHFRADLDAGKSRPFWNDFWGPKPNQPQCGAPPEMLHRYGFRERAA